MKKIYICVTIIIVLILIGGGVFFLTKKGNPGRQGPLMGESIDSLEVGNIVSVFVESGTDNAKRIMVCESLEACQMPKSGRGGNNNFSAIVGTVKNIDNNNVELELETGESKTIILSDQTQIFENQFKGGTPPQKFEN
jgi:hypothetical protein